MKIPPRLHEIPLKSQHYEDAIVASAISSAEAFAQAHNETPTYAVYALTASGEKVLTEFPFEVSSSGSHFVIPVAIPEDTPSGDNRSFKKNSITVRDLPLPLMWQIKTGSGHDGAVVVGRIDSIERVENGLGNARGVFDVGVFGREAERMVRNRFLRGVSADLDMFEAQTQEDADELASKNDIKSQKIVVDSARLMGITIVPKPAFQECYIMIEDQPTLEIESAPLEEGIVFEETPNDYEYELAALAASAAPITPPKSWFTNPNLKRPTPLTITDDGKVFGHIASWSTSHIGMGRGIRPPRSASQYAYFRTGALRTQEGDDVQVGQLTLAGGHASMTASADEAIKHYDDTASAVADVTAGEDQYGIWVAGALRPDVTPSQIRAFRASSPSGDWRPINGRLELVAVCQVNVPGFPLARAITASGGVPGAIVAAGAAVLAEIRETDKLSALEQRVASMESTAFSAKIESSRSRMAALVENRNAELAARADAVRERMQIRQVSEEAELSSKIEALKARFNVS